MGWKRTDLQFQSAYGEKVFVKTLNLHGRPNQKNRENNITNKLVPNSKSTTFSQVIWRPLSEASRRSFE